MSCAVLLLAACASSPSGAVGPVCHASQLRAAFGAPVSEATGQATLILTLTNVGGNCILDGYPRVSFYDSDGLVPFRIRHRGDQMIAGRSPRPVPDNEGKPVVVMINKYRCDLGDRRLALQLRLSLDGARISPPLNLAHQRRAFAWCGSGDPGSTVDVTPYEPSVKGARP